jgi:hypothetical protein
VSGPSLFEDVSGGPVWGWLIVCPLAGWNTGGGWGVIYGFWGFSRASKILFGAMLDSTLRWLFIENSL